jgi:deoxyadenosine/deoxycytidine kinase
LGGVKVKNGHAKKGKALKAKLFVAMAGNIGAGKTTAAKMISQKFGFELFDEPVIDNRFLKHYYGDMKRWSFTLQLEFLIKRVEHHERAKSCIQIASPRRPRDLAKYLTARHVRRRPVYFDFSRAVEEHRPPDKVICPTCPTNVLLRRIKRGREEEKAFSSSFCAASRLLRHLPMVIQNKYGVDALTDVTCWTSATARAGRVPDKISTFLSA